MNISKQRLIEIIKEELQEDVAGNPMFPVQDIERGAKLQQGDDLDAIKNELVTLLSTLEHNDAVDVMMGVASALGLNPPEDEEAMDDPEGEYGKEGGNIGFVTTREGLEELIASELAEMLGK
jgi:acyl carrier protein